jgi:tRNA pseudouridine55 synthase
MADGILNVYKEQGITSHDVVNKLRRIFNTKTIGHAGTLDPNATGVLVVGVGKGTKVIEYLENDTKEYITELTLGIKTDTEDIWGQILEKNEVNSSEDEIIGTILSFKGKIEQIPPMYSAIKISGKKLYEYAREGQIIERKSRQVEITDISDIIINGNKVNFKVCCSKGTYIRTLCNDIGEKLGCKATMSSLERTRAGVFVKDTSHKISYIEEQRDKLFIDVESVIKQFPIINLENEDASKYLNGVRININKEDSKYRIYLNNKFYGVGSVKNNILKSEKRIV